jgi:dimethylglycine dehydrogenase
LQRITRDDVALGAFLFRDIRQTYVGDVPVILSRISFSGELGYEIYCKPQYLLKLTESIEEAGADLGYRWYGARTLLALRLEKQWGVWTLDFRPDFTAAESGMDAFIKWDKDFIGKAAAETERKNGPKKKLLTLTIDSEKIDVSNDEAILKDGETIGYISSGGYAHYVQKSVALGYVPTEFSTPGTKVQVEIIGEMYDAEIQDEPIYDPEGKKMRG